MDIDMDDNVEQKQVPSRPSRFAPKNSRLKPQTKMEVAHVTNTQVVKPKPDQHELNPSSFKKEEEDESSQALAMDASKTEPELSESNDFSNMETDFQEEEDMVVREVDVYFNPSIDDETKLYVFQYPLRPSWRPYELDERCEEVRLKPSTGEVQVELSVDVNSKHFDKDDSSKANMTKMVLASSPNPPQVSRYAVGVLKDNKLHLNPIHALAKLVPSSTDSAPDGTKGTTTNKNKKTEFSVDLKTDDKECWVPLQYHGPKTDFSAKYLERMTAQENAPISFTMSPDHYVDSLCRRGASNAVNRPNGTSKRSLLEMPLEDRIKKLLCEGAPRKQAAYRFDSLMHFASDYSAEDVLGVLQNHAHLVQGRWAPKSELLLKSSDIAKRARDYCLLLFSRSPFMKVSSLSGCSKPFEKALKELLGTLAVERPKLYDWRFIESTDCAFIKHYPEIVKKQEEVWYGIENMLRNSKEIGRKAAPITAKALSKPGNPMDSDKTETESKSGAHGERSSISAETREALLKTVPKVLQKYKVCSYQLICQGLRDMAVSQATLPKAADARTAVTAAKGVDAPREELEEILSQCAVTIRGFYVSKLSIDHPEHNELRDVVINLLNGPGEKLRKAEVYEAARHVLKREPTSLEYGKVMTELCESKGSVWMLKSSDGRLK